MFFLKNIIDFISEIIFPKFCLGCGRIGLYLCDKCQKKIKDFDNRRCFYCHKKSLFGLTHPNCLKPDRFNGYVAFYQYNWLLKKIIKSLKYRLATQVWQEFKKNILLKKLSLIKNWGRIDYIHPVPIDKKKLNKRGFNQALLISEYFNDFLRLKQGNFLVRKKERKPQANISSKKIRKKNIKGCFLAINKEKIVNKNILLVDDVITTGATIEEITKVLRKAGAKNIFVLTLAKG